MATAIPKNRAPFTVEEMARATGGTIVREGPPTVGICTDSRDITEGAAFVALVGDNFDGHAFLERAASLGARTLIAARDTPGSAALVRVLDTRRALGALARAHRLRWARTGSRSLVAITGSAGKTTTKAVLARLLEVVAPAAVHASTGNLNNDVGVPMTLFGLEERHRYGVVEVGTSARGEIENLAGVAQPDAAVLTLVAVAHTEGLGTLDEVAIEKGSLLEALPENGLAVVNADDPRALGQLARSRAHHRRTYGVSEKADYRIALCETLGARGARVRIERAFGSLEAESPLLGGAGAHAVAASLAVAEWMIGRPLRPDELGEALVTLGPDTAGRLAPLALADGTLVIDDSYNANPASMRSSLEVAGELAATEKRRLILVLGEMRELGAASKAEHERLGHLAAQSAAAHVIGVGGDAERLVREAANGGKSARFAPDAEQGSAIVLQLVEAGDAVLVKGSRGVATEKIVRALVEHRGRAPLGRRELA